MRIVFVGLILFGGAAMAAPGPAEPVLHLCVRHVRTPAGEDDFRSSFALGPIRVPAGTVFAWSGHVFGDAADPRDDSHRSGIGWAGVSQAESERRVRVVADDMRRGMRNSSALITLAEVRLTRNKPCADVLVAAALSGEWGWKEAPIFGASDIFFTAFGVVRSANFVVAERDDLNGILQGTTSRSISVPATR